MIKEPKNIATQVTNNLLSMMGQISDGISKMSGGEPYDAQSISREKQRKIYEALTEEEMFVLIGRHGKMAVEDYIKSFEEHLNA